MKKPQSPALNILGPTVKRLIVEIISNLPPNVLQKLLLAEDRAQDQGDHRSILDPSKCSSLLKEADPTMLQAPYMIDLIDSIDAVLKEPIKIDENFDEIIGSIIKEEKQQQAEKLADKLADKILTICGINGSNSFLDQETRARYPLVNKADLVKLGAHRLTGIIMFFLFSPQSDNRIPIAKCNEYMAHLAADQATGNLLSNPQEEEPNNKVSAFK